MADFGSHMPFSKTGDEHDWMSHRLISLLSIVGKLFKSVIVARLRQPMNDQDLLIAAQFGFQKGRRCQEPAWVLTETIKYMARRGRNTFAAFIDVKKAYPSNPTVLRIAIMARLHTKLSEAKPWWRWKYA